MSEKLSTVDASKKATAEQLADYWVSQKLSGKRIIRSLEGVYGNRPTLQQQRIFVQANKIYGKKIRNPGIRSQLDDTTEIINRARDLGFKRNINEFIKLNQRSYKKLIGKLNLNEKLKVQKLIAAQKKEEINAAKLKKIKQKKKIIDQTINYIKNKSNNNLILTKKGLQNVTRQQLIDKALGKTDRDALNKFILKYGLSTSLAPGKGAVSLGPSSGNIKKDLYDLQKELSKTKINKAKAKTLVKRLKGEGKLAGLGFTSQFLRNIEAVIDTPKTLRELGTQLKNDPNAVKNISKRAAKALKKGTQNFVILAKTNPGEAIGRVGGEIVFLKGADELLRLLGRGVEVAGAKLSPKYTKLKNGKLIVELNNGRKVDVGLGGGLTETSSSTAETIIKKAGGSGGRGLYGGTSIGRGIGKGIYNTGSKGVDISNKVILDVVNKIPKDSLKNQLKKAGKTINAVSSQRDALFNLIKRRRIIRKPIPGEENLPKKVRAQLQKFDRGKLNANQIIKLDREIRKVELKKGLGKPKGLLERSFFADPNLKVRPSRLGLESDKGASIIDIIKGNVRLKKNKPEILLFDNVKVQDLPKSLESVKKKLRTGKNLTQKEADQLLNFQLKKSGKFKPIGFFTKESEVTLAPGEIIRKKKKVATTVINGRRVDIVTAEVYKPSKSTKKLLKDYESGKLSKKQIRSLDKKLKKETKIDYGVSSSKSLNKKYLPIKRISTSLTVSSIGRSRRGSSFSRLSKRSRSSKIKIPSKTYKSSSSYYSKSSTSSGSKTSKGSSTSRGSKGSKSKSTKTSRVLKVKRSLKPKRSTLFKKSSRKRRINKQNSNRGYNVYARPVKKIKGKKRNKLIKVNKVPLSKSRAEDLRNYISDTSLARTAQIKPTSKKPKRPLLKIPAGYAQRTKRKFRNYKIRKGKRVPLKKGSVIELNNYLLDTFQEKRKISLRRRINQISRKPKTRKVRVKSKRR